MGTCSFRDFEEVCRRLGLLCRVTGKGYIWEGIDQAGNLLRVSIHKHAGGRDIPAGTFHSMVKELGFANEQEFYRLLNNKRKNN